MQKRPSPVVSNLPGLSCSLWPAGSDHKESIHAFSKEFVEVGGGDGGERGPGIFSSSARAVTGTGAAARTCAEAHCKPGKFVRHSARQKQTNRRRFETGRLQGFRG